LKKIEVFTGWLLFKKYQLTHVKDAQGYQRVSKLQEFNGANEAANPILFEYNTTQGGAVEITTPFNEIIDLNFTSQISGDFDGDGRLDFLFGYALYTKLFQGNGSITGVPFFTNNRLNFTATTLSTGKLNQKQSIVRVDETMNSLNFKTYNFNTNNNNVEFSGNKQIDYNNVGYCNDYCTTIVYDSNGFPVNSSECTSPTFQKNSNKYIEGDFNGDGISEVLIFGFQQTKNYEPIPIPPAAGKKDSNTGSIVPPDPVNCEWKYVTSSNVIDARILDLNPNASSVFNTSGYYSVPNPIVFLDGERFVMDFNSDGKSDVLIIEKSKNYQIIGFKQLQAAPWVELEILGEGTLDEYSPTKAKLFGDFNGDGKPEIMIPDADGYGCDECVFWHVYYGNPKPTGGSFFSKKSVMSTAYKPYYSSGGESQKNSYFALDINKDGKSDIVRVWSRVFQFNPFWDPNDLNTEWRAHAYINNIDYNNSFTSEYDTPPLPNGYSYDNNIMPIPIASNYKRGGLDSDLLVIRNSNSFEKLITYIDFKKDFNKDNLLTKVTQSNGAIVDEIEYKKMEPETGTNDLGTSSSFYSSTESLNYPLVELKKIPTNMLVSKITNTSLGETKKQLFKYHGYAVDLTGSGIIGFIKTARSSWFRNSSDKVTWNVSENNPQLRGAAIKTYSQLLNGGDEFSFENTSLNILMTAENQFTQTIDPVSKRYSLLLNKKTSKDILTNVVSETTNDSYSTDYLLPTSITTKNFLGNTLQGTSITTNVFENNTSGIGSNYYIGRPKQTTSTVLAYGDTQTSTEKYFYTGSNISRTEKNANGAPETIVETFDYFSNGLLKSKTISAIGTSPINAVSPRTTSYTYDATNRFTKTITDTEGLVTTNNTYHGLYGMVLNQTNPLGQVTSSIYDNWGKRTKITDFLGKSINYTYTRTGNVYTTTETGDDGSSAFSESDALARIIRKGAKDLNGNWNYVASEYDYQGKKTRDSEPYSTSTSLWTSYFYDDYGRNIKTILPTGKTVTTIYSDLTATVNDEVMTKSKTVNANGHVVTTTDTPGGTVTFKYNAGGNLIESNYDGVKITTAYDQWGRRTSLTDTSAGTYTTEYNAFGETLKEISPKGTTSYVLNAVGKPITKTVLGATDAEKTNITNTYTYDPTNKWVTRIDVANPNDGNSSYQYGYDTATKQLKQTIETLPYATFTKNLTFDTFGRVDTETTTGVAHGKTSTKTIKHTYKNGSKWQMLDGTTVIWQANTVNAKGQLTGASLGNGINITNTYNQYGYPTQIKHELGTTNPVNVMTLTNTFEPKTGNLTSRYNSLFEITENFKYDSLDRLVQWTSIPEEFARYNFNSGLEGFVPYGSGATVSNYLGQLRVVATGDSMGAQKEIVTNAVVGQVINIKGIITKITSTSPIIAVISETNPSTLEVHESFMSVMSVGAFNFNYTVQQYSTIKIRFTTNAGFIEGRASGKPTNGESQDRNKTSQTLATTTNTANFLIDNLVLSKTVEGSDETQAYDDRGRITANKTGTYNYLNTDKPYQQTSVTPVNANEAAYYASRGNLSITYNAFKAPIQIEEIGKDKLSFAYNGMLERSAMYYGSIADDRLARPNRRYYSGDGSMEVNYNVNSGAVEFVTFIGGDAYNAPIVLKSNGTVQNYFYLHRNYQGNILAITNATGGFVEKRYFDAWGAVTKVQDGAGNNLGKLTFFDRGYTGHEHLQSVGLIHMNGRLYDPKLHRFLQPDNFVQDPYNTQNYNRYGYVLNNPLKYTDPSGEELVSAIIIGAAVGLASYLTISIINDQPISLIGAVKATVIGAISGAVTFGIGQMTQGITCFYTRAACQAFLHGTFQGLSSGIQGGGFWQGFASGALSSIAASAWSGGATTDTVYKTNGNMTAGRFVTQTTSHQGIGGFLGMSGAGSQIVFGTIAGGAGAALTGGNFWKGAVTGLVVSGLNHAMHQDPPVGKRPDSDGKITLAEANDWYRNGNGKSLYADLSKIDLEFINISDFKGVGDIKTFQTLVNSSDGFIYGNITLKYEGGTKVSVTKGYHDTYNFERHNSRSTNPNASERVKENAARAFRNFATVGGRMLADRFPVNLHNQEFKIYFYGYGKISK